LLLHASAGSNKSLRSIVKDAYADKTGKVHIVRGDGHDVRIRPERGQVDLDGPYFAEDGQTVGRAVSFRTDCVTYPIPGLIVVYRAGKVVRLDDGFMVYRWDFVDKGQHVAVSSGSIHWMHGIHLTLYDAGTGKRLAVWDGEEEETPPEWGAGVAH